VIDRDEDRSHDCRDGEGARYNLALTGFAKPLQTAPPSKT